MAYARGVRRWLLALLAVAVLVAACDDSGGSAAVESFDFSLASASCGDDEVLTSHVTAFDLESGDVRWSERVPFTGRSSAQMQLAGDRLVLLFREAGLAGSLGVVDRNLSGGVAALSIAGDPLWQHDVGWTRMLAVDEGVVALGAVQQIGSGLVCSDVFDHQDVCDAVGQLSIIETTGFETR